MRSWMRRAMRVVAQALEAQPPLVRMVREAQEAEHRAWADLQAVLAAPPGRAVPVADPLAVARVQLVQSCLVAHRERAVRRRVLTGFPRNTASLLRTARST